MRPAFATLLGALLCGCASDFDPSIKHGEDDSIVESDGMGEDDSASEDSGGEDPDPTAGSQGSGSDDSSSDDSTEDSGGEDPSDTSDTDEPLGPPAFGEPCDPFLAFNGEAPCQADPEHPAIPSTCVPVQDVVNLTWGFLCVSVKDSQGDGDDLGDPCSDAGGHPTAGCMNSFCLSNGLGNFPETDVYENHPPIPSDDACPFIWWSPDDVNHEGEGYFVKACCSSFCDAANPCEVGWTCKTTGAIPETENGVGVCVWE